jgi:thioredoxin reductase (NADPH)
VLIAGAGPIGLACAISAKRRGVDPLVIDAGAIANSICRYPIGMTFFTTPERLEIGNHPIVCAGAKPTREEAMKYYRGVARVERLRVRTFTPLLGAHRDGTVIRATIVPTASACRANRFPTCTPTSTKLTSAPVSTSSSSVARTRPLRPHSSSSAQARG